MFCTNCGKEIGNQEKFCTNCGTSVVKNNENQESVFSNNNSQMSNEDFKTNQNFASSEQSATNKQQYTYAPSNVIKELCEKEKIGLYIWIAVVCFQVLAGFLIPSSWIFAIWNIYACYTHNNFIKQMQANPTGVYDKYEKALSTDIVFIVLNVLLGGIIGAAGACYDIYIRSIAMKHKEELLKEESDYAYYSGTQSA